MNTIIQVIGLIQQIEPITECSYNGHQLEYRMQYVRPDNVNDFHMRWITPGLAKLIKANSKKRPLLLSIEGQPFKEEYVLFERNAVVVEVIDTPVLCSYASNKKICKNEAAFVQSVETPVGYKSYYWCTEHENMIDRLHEDAPRPIFRMPEVE